MRRNSIGNYVHALLNPILSPLVSRPCYGVFDVLFHALTFFFVVMTCSNTSFTSFQAVLSFLCVIFSNRITHVYTPVLPHRFDSTIDMEEFVKWSYFATSRQRKRKRARWRRRIRHRNGVASGKKKKKKFRHRKLPYHLVLKCLRRVGNKPLKYRQRQEYEGYVKFAQEIPQMTRRLKKLQKLLKSAERDLASAHYESLVNTIPEFNGYLSSSKTGRFCYTEDVPLSSINEFCSSFDPIESYRLMMKVESERVVLKPVSDGDSYDGISMEDHHDMAQATVRRANLFIENGKAFHNRHKCRISLYEN